MGDVLQFPGTKGSNVIPLFPAKTQAERTCFGCFYYAVGPSGVHCVFFHEPIYNEVTEAADCGAFEPGDEGA